MYSKALTYEDPSGVLEPLFERAKATDEFEFCCTLMRFRGVESPGWDPLIESQTLAQQVLALVQIPVESGFRMRLLLFLYCHLTEMQDLYFVPANLLRVCSGERYSAAPFGTASKGFRLPTSPSGKVAHIAKAAPSVGLSSVGQLYSEMLIREVRNAFFHSDYVLTEQTFNIRDGDGVNIERLIQQSVPYDWLLPRLELGINTALVLFDLLVQHARSYTAHKIVRGRFSSDGSYTDLELIATPEYGLTGFRSVR